MKRRRRTYGNLNLSMSEKHRRGTKVLPLVAKEKMRLEPIVLGERLSFTLTASTIISKLPCEMFKWPLSITQKG